METRACLAGQIGGGGLLVVAGHFVADFFEAGKLTGNLVIERYEINRMLTYNGGERDRFRDGEGEAFGFKR